MIFDGTLFDSFREQYGVRNIECDVVANSFFSGGSLGEERYYRSLDDTEVRVKYYRTLDDTEVRIEMCGAGFRKMMQDLFSPSGDGQRYFRTTFEIEKLDASDDTLWVAKYDTERHDVATVEALAKKLMSDFPDKTIIFLPKGINIEMMGAEGIAALRDHLNSILKNLNYDNIMGF